MAYRAMPNTVTGYIPFFLSQGRELQIPCSDNLKPRVATENPDVNRWLENLKASLRTAYKLAFKANQKSEQANTKLNDRKAKEQNINLGDLVYLYIPAKKPGITPKLHKPWGVRTRYVGKFLS